MTCTEITDQHFCAMALLGDGKCQAVYNTTTAELFRELAAGKMVDWDESSRPIHPHTRQLGYGYATLLPDGKSALDDYRELGADV
jgi:hypothetical protein